MPKNIREIIARHESPIPTANTSSLNKGQHSFSISALGLPELWLAEPNLNKA